MSEKYQNLLTNYKEKLNKALSHLEYSYNKVKKLSNEADKLDDETLETWESFTARFSRVVDFFLTKYLRTYVLINDPGFNGSLRDFTNQGEKLNLIDNADDWMRYREYRNTISHEYTDEELSILFKNILNDAPHVLKIKKLL
jgi:hypothetical protein